MTVGVYVTEHVAIAPVPPNVQVVNVPVPLLVKLTEPPGVMAVPGEVSVIVTLQLVTLLTTMVDGWQEMVVVVLRTVTVTTVLPELGECGGVCVSPW